MEEARALNSYANSVGLNALLDDPPERRAKWDRKAASWLRRHRAKARLDFLEGMEGAGFRMDADVIAALADQLYGRRGTMQGGPMGFSANPIYGGGAGPGTPMPGVLPFHDVLRRGQ
jgi:hypothetical protein